jgi:hypothetical protein
MYNTISKSQLAYLENSKYFIKDIEHSRTKAGITFYSLINLDFSDTGYYLSLREHEDSDDYDYIWCNEKSDANHEFTIKFEKLLDNLDGDVKTELLFHLDIFT